MKSCRTSFDEINTEYFGVRQKECADLFRNIELRLPVSRRSCLSLGCGTGAEFDALLLRFKTVVGVEKDSRYVEFAKRNHPAVCVMHDFAIRALEGFSVDSFDAIVALDVDSTLFAQDILRHAKRILPSGGVVVFSERAKNVELYGRSFLKEGLADLRGAFAGLFSFKAVIRNTDRDGVVVIAVRI